MTYEEWVEQYRPIKNHFHDNRGFDGLMFETFGQELNHVHSQDHLHVWTLLDEDGHTWIGSGFHVVNRMGYFITEVPFEGDFLEIPLDDPDDHDRLIIKTGISEAAQQGGFMNATLQSAGENLAISIAIHLPEHANDFDNEEELITMLREDFRELTRTGYTVEIQIGPINEPEESDDA